MNKRVEIFLWSALAVYVLIVAATVAYQVVISTLGGD